jgi:hypothetical protein
MVVVQLTCSSGYAVKSPVLDVNKTVPFPLCALGALPHTVASEFSHILHDAFDTLDESRFL